MQDHWSTELWWFNCNRKDRSDPLELFKLIRTNWSCGEIIPVGVERARYLSLGCFKPVPETPTSALRHPHYGILEKIASYCRQGAISESQDTEAQVIGVDVVGETEDRQILTIVEAAATDPDRDQWIVQRPMLDESAQLSRHYTLHAAAKPAEVQFGGVLMLRATPRRGGMFG